MVFDPYQVPTYQSSQADVGLMPPMMAMPPVVFPGQVSAAIASGGYGAAASIVTGGSPGTSFGAGMFPAQQLQTFTNQSPMLQGPTGIMMPMTPSAPYNSMAGPNPYAGLTAMGPYSGPPTMYTPRAPTPPPVYTPQTSPMPFSPSVPSPHFNTPYMAGIEREHLGGDLSYARGVGMAGVGVHMGMNLMAGAAGAQMGSRFGMAGAVIGGAAGFLGSELSGLGGAAQNGYMNFFGAPAIHHRAMTSGIMEQSQHYMTSGGFLNANGSGFDHHTAASIASGIRDMSGSSSFRAQTGNRFNQNDLFSMMQSAGHEDMLAGSQNATQSIERVRETAKALNAFMQMAQEPDVQRAIQTMGSLRASGLNLNETTQAVSNGRAFARLAGQSFGDMMSVGGSMGSQTMQAMGLSQGLGMQVGMQNYGVARGSMLAGSLSPQMMSLVGGAGGLANMNNMFSGSMLQMPMLAPSMMASHGGINQQALAQFLGGRTNAFSQAGAASNALSGIAGAQGVEGLGLAIGMQPMIQDTIGRAMQARGPFAQRNIEDQNILSTMRQMGMSGAGGFMTMAQTMGMSGSQALARAQEVGSPLHYSRMRQQIEVNRLDERQSEREARAAAAPGFFATLAHGTMFADGQLGREIGRGVNHAMGLDHHSHYAATTDAGARRDRRMSRSDSYTRFAERMSSEGRARDDRRSYFTDVADDLDVASAEGFGGIGTYIAGVMGVGSINTRSRLNNFREGSRLLGLTASTSNAEQTAATRSMTDAFGAGTTSELQQRMAASMAQRLDNGVFGSAGRALFNITGRGAAAAQSGGLADIGNLFQSRQISAGDIRADFLRHAEGLGINRDRASDYFRNNSSAVVQSASADLQAILTPQQQAQLFEQAERSAGRGTGRGGTSQVRAENEHALQTKLFGRASAEMQDSFLNTMENVRGIGREGSRENEASRRYVMARATLSQRVRQVGANSPEGRRLLTQIEQLTTAARRQNVDTNSTDLRNQITGAANRMGEGGASDMARAFAINNADLTGDQLLARVGEGEETSSHLRQNRREADGFGALASGSGALADALRGAGAGDVSRYDRARVRAAIQGLGRDGLIGRSEAEQRLIRRIQAGGQDGERALTELGGMNGERGETLRRKYRNERSTIMKWWDSKVNGGEDGYVNEQMARTTAADGRADSANSDVANAENAAGSAGMTGAANTLNQAAASLERAANQLNSVTQGGALNSMIGGGT